MIRLSGNSYEHNVRYASTALLFARLFYRAKGCTSSYRWLHPPNCLHEAPEYPFNEQDPVLREDEFP